MIIYKYITYSIENYTHKIGCDHTVQDKNNMSEQKMTSPDVYILIGNCYGHTMLGEKM